MADAVAFMMARLNYQANHIQSRLRGGRGTGKGNARRQLAEVQALQRMIGRVDGGLCDCWDADKTPPGDPDNGWAPMLHHYDCAAYEAAQYLSMGYAGFTGWHPDFKPFEYDRPGRAWDRADG